MCGISGGITLNSVTTARQRVRQMSNSLSHRGPDGEGNYSREGVVFSMRRLAIIDVSGSQQPLYSEDKSIAVVGNGEIYNYVELRKSLKRRGHTLQTKGDIETIIHLYEEQGWKGVSKLRGMFALALHDNKRKKVFLFRDRIGEKPLYYTQTDEGFYFSSEMKSILPVVTDRKLNFSAIDEYFHLLHVPEPSTPISSINKLPAGAVLEINCRNLQTTLEYFWSLDDIMPVSKEFSENKISDLFHESCKLTLRADVPVGISLSGGVDSSAIAAISQKYSSNNLVAITVGYKNFARLDERESARSFAKKLGIKHEFFQMDDEEIIHDFPSLVWSCDDPIAEIGMFNINAIYKLAHDKNIKVLLSGVGGDELFWGYPWVRETAALSLLKRKHSSNPMMLKLRSILSNGVNHPRMYNSLFGLINHAISPADQIILNDTRPVFRAAEFFTKHLYSKSFKRSLPKYSAYAFLQHPTIGSNIDLLHTVMRLICQRWLTSHAIAINDRLSMSHGVEVRLPFLDYKLIEYIFSHKQTVGAYSKPRKYWFYKAISKELSEDVFARPKQGFTPPVVRWMSRILVAYTHLLDRGFLVSEEIISRKMIPLIKIQLLNPLLWPSLFQLVVLETWGREFVWKESPESIAESRSTLQFFTNN